MYAQMAAVAAVVAVCIMSAMVAMSSPLSFWGMRASTAVSNACQVHQHRNSAVHVADPLLCHHLQVSELPGRVASVLLSLTSTAMYDLESLKKVCGSSPCVRVSMCSCVHVLLHQLLWAHVSVLRIGHVQSRLRCSGSDIVQCVCTWV
jgi:hypothetical protein